MSVESMADKADWRRRFRAGVKALTQAQREEASAHARNLLREQRVWQQAGAILFYTPMSNELDLLPLLDEALQVGKAAALPGFVNEMGAYQAFEVSHSARDCASGKFGIAEPGAHCAPMPLKRLDLVLVPGLGFDMSGRRLGRGQGFYDRLLAGINGVKCGVAFDQQVVAQIPAVSHDVNMNFILTPTRWLEIPESNAVQP